MSCKGFAERFIYKTPVSQSARAFSNEAERSAENAQVRSCHLIADKRKKAFALLTGFLFYRDAPIQPKLKGGNAGLLGAQVVDKFADSVT
jgi:hypothetical protein